MGDERRLRLEPTLRNPGKSKDKGIGCELGAATKQKSIQKQQNHRADDGHDPAGHVIFSDKNTADPGTNERAGDAEKNCDDTTTRIFSRHQQFRDGAYDEADHQNPQNRVRAKVHNEPSSIGFAARRQDFKK